MFKGPLKPAELCEYTLAPPVKAASDRKTGHIRPFVVRLPPVYFHAEIQTPLPAQMPQCNVGVLLIHNTLFGIIATHYLVCWNYLFPGYFRSSPVGLTRDM